MPHLKHSSTVGAKHLLFANAGSKHLVDTCKPDCDGFGIDPNGCIPCLCFEGTGVYLCVRGEAAPLDELNTTDPVLLTGAAGGPYTYEEATVRKFVVTVTGFDANNYQQAKIEAYTWNGAIWVLERTLGPDTIDGNLCQLIYNPVGSVFYSMVPREPWTTWNTWSVTFAGITYVTDGSCTEANHVSGTFNGVTYTGDAPSSGPDYPHADFGADCGGVSETDAGIVGTVSGNIGIVTVVTTVISGGVRGVTIEAKVTFGGNSNYYFYAELDMGSDNCDETFVVANEIVGACDLIGGRKSIGHGGTATITLS